MRILFCTSLELTRFGGLLPVYVGLRDELVRGGHEVDIVGSDEIGFRTPGLDTRQRLLAVSALTKRYLLEKGDAYDIVEYDHEHLPYPRSELPSKPLFVARTALLVQHFAEIQPPRRVTLRSAVGRFLRSFQTEDDEAFRIRCADMTMRAADRVAVPNTHDRDLLVRRGVKPERIWVTPYGMSAERRRLFEEAGKSSTREPVFAFVGTFDYRKGAVHFGPILERVARAVPGVRLRLLGARGLMQESAQVLDHFPRSLHSRVELHMTFERARLGALLSDASVGIFPSYVEGFPFGVLEMMAAGLPVVAFDAPGPPMIVPEKFLVRPGDEAEMAERVVRLLTNRAERDEAGADAVQRAAGFTWERFASETLAGYEAALLSR